MRGIAYRDQVTAARRVHLVDGTYELFRAHFAPRPEHRDPSGEDRKATVGVVSSLLALLHDPEEAVTHLAVAFDNPIRSFRNDLFSAYKSDEGVPPELRAQFDPVEEAVRALGVVVWSMREHEADDGLATGARKFAGEVDQLAATLAAQRDDALFYRRLATLVDDVPLAESLADLEFRGVPRAAFEAWCDRIGARTLRTAPRRWQE